MPEPELRTIVESDHDLVVVALEGELDLCTVPGLATTVRELRAAGFRRVRLDLRGLSFMDSTGLHFILGLLADAGEGFELTVVQGGRAVKRVFELTGLEPRIPFVRASGWAGDARLKGAA